MKKHDTKIEGIIKNAVTYMVDTELYEWPPQCTAFLYQPIRPQNKEHNQLRKKCNEQEQL